MEGDEGAIASPGARPPRRRICRICGQVHPPHEPHVYDYVEEVDEDVTCHICLQPLVTPVDTPCGHTFCKPCLLSYMKIQQVCPVDRRPLQQKLCSYSSLVLKKILEKLKVKCPNVSDCDLVASRGDLEDHLKYRCPGNWVCCQYSAAGCDYKGPQRSIPEHALECTFKDTGISKPPILEGQITHIEIARTQNALGITIVGGADTPLRCVVVQEVFPDGLLAQDGRIQPGDQIIEVDGADMTSATHQQICQDLRKTPSVLRLGVYRERIEVYRTVSPSNVNPLTSPSTKWNDALANRETLNVTLTRESGRQLGIKLGGRRTEPGIFIMEILEASVAAHDGRLRPQDRILAINGGDVRYARLDLASKLIQQSRAHVSLIVCRGSEITGEYDHLFKQPHPSLSVAHSRTKSAPDRLAARVEYSHNSDHNKTYGDVVDGLQNIMQSENTERSVSVESLNDRPTPLMSTPNYHNGSLTSPSDRRNSESLGSLTDFGNHYQSNGSLGSTGLPLINSTSSLISPLRNSQNMIDIEESSMLESPPALPPRSRQPLPRTDSHDHLEEHNLLDPNLIDVNLQTDQPETTSHALGNGLSAAGATDVPDGPILSKSKGRRSKESSDLTDLCHGIRKSLKIDGSASHQKTVTISKSANESLGMRIGGGVNSNEGDTPIYIANINPQGPVGKSKQVKKGDVLLSVNGQSLLGLTHSQAVGLLKATAELAGVTLSLLEGAESSFGPANFVPSWLYWQKLPRSLHLSKSVVLHRPQGTSLGFSIVGGSDPQRGSEPIHVLFVVSTSPAAMDGKLRCGDRLLAVDGHTLEGISHSSAVSLLKQAGHRVHLEVVSWLGTEV